MNLYYELFHEELLNSVSVPLVNPEGEGGREGEGREGFITSTMDISSVSYNAIVSSTWQHKGHNQDIM